MNRRAVVFLTLAFAAALDSRAARPPYRYRRGFQVSSPGWVRVTMPLAVRARLTASGGDLSVRDPKGTPLPLFPWEEPPEAPASSRMVPLSGMETVPGG